MGFLIKIFFCTLMATPLLLFVPKNIKPYLNLILNLFIAGASTYMAMMAYQQGTLYYYLTDLPLVGPVHLKIDELSAIFILVINFTVITSSLFSIGYLPNRRNAGSTSWHLFSFSILHASMLLVCMTQDLLAFILFWEIMSLCSFVQVLSDLEDPVAIKALNYFVQMHINVVLLMIAVAWLYNKTGMQNFDALHFYFSSNNNFPLFLLFFLSFGMTAGFLPLPTYPTTPGPSAGLMSGVMIKIGVYGMLRILVYVESELLEIGMFIYVLSMIIGLYGIIQATLQKDFKKMLGYSNIENIGIIGMGIGLGVLGIALNSQLITFMGFAGALMHVINHSLFKSLLFYTAGSVFLRTGTRQMNRLGGLIKKMPVTSILFLIGSLALCGLPPFNGFVSKFLIYSGMMGLLRADFSMDLLELVALMAFVLMGGISVFTFTRAYGVMFLGTPKSLKATKASEVNFFMLFPNVLIVLVMLSIGFAPDIFVKFISMAVNLYIPFESTGIVIHQFDSISQLGLVSILFIILMVTIYMIRTLIVKSNTETYEPTKGTGYTRSRDKLKYAGPSYSGNLAQFIKPITQVKTAFKENVFFLKDRPSKTEENLGLVKKLSLFAKMQNGQTRQYILFMFLLIVLLLLLIVFNII